MGDELKLFLTELTASSIECSALLVETVGRRMILQYVNIHLQNKVIVSRHTTKIASKHVNEKKRENLAPCRHTDCLVLSPKPTTAFKHTN